ncbi:O-antigen ligase family protein [Halobacteriovorax sp. ZH4_bin.1]|uniref:O-antigen ligase family protein n=1 Tax=unclassified Halobacteriovorax TaxID=2639665 RepID=UPI003722E736
MTESRKLNLFAWAIFFYLVMTIFHKAFVAVGMLLILVLAFYTSKESYAHVFKDKKHIFFTSLVFIFILSILINGAGDFNKIKYYLPPIFLTASFYHFGPRLSDKWIKKIVFWFILLSAISSLVGTLTILFDFNILKFKIDTYPRNKGAFLGIMYYSYSNAIICAMSIAALVHYKKFKKYLNFKLLIISLVLNLIGLYFTYTRGAILALIASLPFVFYYTNKKIFTSIFILGVFLATAVIYIIFGNSNLSFYRFKPNSGSDAERIAMFKTAYYMYLKKPVIGHGFQNFKEVCKGVQEEYDLKPRHCAFHSHNQYLDAFALAGTIGGIVFILFFGSWLLTYFTGYRDIYLFSLPGLVTFLTICMTDTPLYMAPPISIIFVLYGMLFVKREVTSEANLV